MWKCSKCDKTFHIYARITEERKPKQFTDSSRILIDRACCPFCESIEFELVKENG